MGTWRDRTVADVMTARVVTVEMDDPLGTVKEIFDHVAFHHLLVVAGGRLRGVISEGDLLAAISPALGTVRERREDRDVLARRAHRIMSRRPIRLTPDAPLAEAVAIFSDHAISCIPVVDAAERPVGIVSWRDLLPLAQAALEEPSA